MVLDVPVVTDTVPAVVTFKKLPTLTRPVVPVVATAWVWSPRDTVVLLVPVETESVPSDATDKKLPGLTVPLALLVAASTSAPACVCSVGEKADRQGFVLRAVIGVVFVEGGRDVAGFH